MAKKYKVKFYREGDGQNQHEFCDIILVTSKGEEDNYIAVKHARTSDITDLVYSIIQDKESWKTIF